MDEYKTTQSFPVFRALGAPRKTALDRMLSVFADVRAGEGVTALLLALNGFLLLSSYYVLKAIRESLILSEAGAEVKSYSSAAQAVVLLFLVPLYGKFASRVNRVKLLTWVTAFFASHLVLFYLVASTGTEVGVVYYVWLGVFNMLFVAQFWAFANDLYSEPQGKRLFPIVGAGISIGGVVGAFSAARLFKPLGAFPMMLLGGIVLAATIPVLRIVHAREARAGARRRVDAEKPLGREGGFQLVFRQRYLLLIAIFVLLLNLVNTTGEFILGKLITQRAGEIAGADLASQRTFIGEFSASIQFWVNLLSMVLQLFLVSRIFLYFGVRGALFFLPLTALSGYTLILTAPVLALVRGVKIAENSMDYSLTNTARHALFLPTSREAKYKGKAAIDAFFARFGDMLHGGLVFAGTHLLVLSLNGFAAVNLALTAVWVGVVVLIAREHKRKTESVPVAA